MRCARAAPLPVLRRDDVEPQDCTATQALADISSVFPPPDATMQVADLGIFGGASVPLVCEDRLVARAAGAPPAPVLTRMAAATSPGMSTDESTSLMWWALPR